METAAQAEQAVVLKSVLMRRLDGVTVAFKFPERLGVDVQTPYKKALFCSFKLDVVTPQVYGSAAGYQGSRCCHSAESMDRLHWVCYH